MPIDGVSGRVANPVGAVVGRTDKKLGAKVVGLIDGADVLGARLGANVLLGFTDGTIVGTAEDGDVVVKVVGRCEGIVVSEGTIVG